MKTSVLMATLGEDGWDRHVPSLLEQTCPPDEIIVVIDRVLEEQQKRGLRVRWPSITFLFNDTNIGQTRSLNRGLNIAQGDIVFRADDDDEYRPDRIKLQLLCFERTGADLVTSWAEGMVSGSKKPYLIKSPTNDEEIKARLLSRNLLVHSSLAFQRKRISMLGGYDENFRFSQDYALYLAAIRSGCYVRRCWRNTGPAALFQSQHHRFNPFPTADIFMRRSTVASSELRGAYELHIGDASIWDAVADPGLVETV